MGATSPLRRREGGSCGPSQRVAAREHDAARPRPAYHRPTVPLGDVIPRVLETAQRLRESGRGSETNTRIHLIDPVLLALGCDPSDFDQVDREIATRGGTLMDYALKLGGVTRLYVEGKCVGKDF